MRFTCTVGTGSSNVKRGAEYPCPGVSRDAQGESTEAVEGAEGGLRTSLGLAPGRGGQGAAAAAGRRAGGSCPGPGLLLCRQRCPRKDPSRVAARSVTGPPS